jgi:hypothetical protein
MAFAAPELRAAVAPYQRRTTMGTERTAPVRPQHLTNHEQSLVDVRPKTLSGTGPSLEERLEKLRSLYQAELITADEYDRRRWEILSEI